MSHIHIPDGVLPLWLWALGWAVTLIGVGVAGTFASRQDARRRVPLLAVVSALMIVAMSSEIIPIAYHVNLAVVGGILLGPVLSVIASFIVVAVLALLGHGGITVLGLNAVIIGIEMIIGWALFRSLITLFGRTRVGPVAFGTTVVTLALTTTALVGIVALGGSEAASRETGSLDPATLRFENPLSEGLFAVGLLSGGEEGAEEPAAGESTGGLSVGRFATVVYTLGPIGWVLEGLLTAAILGYVARVRPGMMWGGLLTRSSLRPQGDDGTVN